MFEPCSQGILLHFGVDLHHFPSDSQNAVVYALSCFCTDKIKINIIFSEKVDVFFGQRCGLAIAFVNENEDLSAIGIHP